MKKLFYFAVAALALAACTREEMAPEKEAEHNVPMVKVSLKAVLNQEDITKAEIDMSEGSTSWAKDDEIAVFTKNGKKAVLKAESDGASVTFAGEIESGDEIEENAVAFYPAAIAIDDEPNKVNMPAAYGSAAEAAKGFPLRGVVGAGGVIEFKHIGALLKLTINDVPANVDNLVFAASGAAITGELNVDATDANKPFCAVGSSSTGTNIITITTAAADRTSPAVFYLPLPVGTYNNGFSVVLQEGTTIVSTKTSTNSLAIARAKVVKMKAFTPEAASGWFVAGGFNGWSTTTTAMTAVEGHADWLVARNINTTDDGFKLYNGAWKGTNGANLHTQYYGNDDTSSGNICPANGKYDIYFNPTTNKYFIANAGEPWIYKTVHLMCDMELDDAKTYYLHVWPHSGAGLNTEWPGIKGTAETISGIPYYSFGVAICDGDFTSNTYDCIFHTEDDAVRYDFRDGALAADATNSDYYASFTGKQYATGVSGTTYGDTVTNPMTQFSDPAKPEGESFWGIFIPTDDSFSRMHWNSGPELVIKNFELASTTEMKLNFNWKSIFFGPSTTSVDSNIDFNVSRSNTDVFYVDLDDTYLCDIYLNIFEKTARIEVITKANATITLYFGVPNYGTYVNYYTFNGRSMAWPGEAMTEYEVFNEVRYYKVNVLGKEFWDTNVALIVVSDGIDYSQTQNFETADWSGHKTAYYFKVVGRDIIQQTEAEAKWTFTSAFTGVDWSSVSWLGSNTPNYIADWKMTSDATNLYVYFKIPTSRVATNKYIYSGYNTDSGGTNAGGNVNGEYNAMSLLFPFEEVSGEVVVKNGEDSEGKIQCPIGTTEGKPEVHGVKKADYAHVEMKIPRAKIGNPTGTIAVNHSYEWYVAGDKNITLAATN